MTDNPDLNPTPEACLAMVIWSDEYGPQPLGSMGFWNSLSASRQRLVRDTLCKIAGAALRHGRTLEDLARHDKGAGDD